MLCTKLNKTKINLELKTLNLIGVIFLRNHLSQVNKSIFLHQRTACINVTNEENKKWIIK